MLPPAICSVFVEAGQPAIVKIESFPFTSYGVLDAKVVRVARDAIPEPDAQSVEGNPAKTTKSSFFGGAQRTQNLVFPVTLSLARKVMEVDAPLVETVSKSMKER